MSDVQLCSEIGRRGLTRAIGRFWTLARGPYNWPIAAPRARSLHRGEGVYERVHAIGRDLSRFRARRLRPSGLDDERKIRAQAGRPKECKRVSGASPEATY